MHISIYIYKYKNISTILSQGLKHRFNLKIENIILKLKSEFDQTKHTEMCFSGAVPETVHSNLENLIVEINNCFPAFTTENCPHYVLLPGLLLPQEICRSCSN